MKAQLTLVVFALSAGCMSPEPGTETVDAPMAASEKATQAEVEAVSELSSSQPAGTLFRRSFFREPGHGRETSMA